MKKLIVANWKMNPQTHREAEQLARGVSETARKVKGVTVVLCPPFVWLTDLSHKPLAGVKFGAQDVFWEERGAFTGEVSPTMLKKSGVEYVIIGHSERRRWLYETDEMVNKKVLAALRAGLNVILCAGESASVRKKGMGAAKHYVREQLRKDLKGVSPASFKSDLIIMYEPIWAISTARSVRSQDNADTPGDAVHMISSMRNFLRSRFHIKRIRVIYGGSVNPQNAHGFLTPKEIDGALVGGASLKAKEFSQIVRIASDL